MSRPIAVTALVLLALTAACSDDESSTPSSTSTPSATATSPPTTATPTTAAPTTTATTLAPTTAAPTTAAPTTAAPTTAAPTTAAPTTEPPMPTVVPGMTQPAVWPGWDTSFDTPEAAATDFIEEAFGVEAFLGEFMAGDSMSGEIEVLSPLDDDDPATTAPTGVFLLLRRVVPNGGWFVLGAGGDAVTIETPEAHGTIEPGMIEVSGVGRGFEGTLVVRAFIAGDRDAEFDFEIAATDWQTSVPYSVTLDLSAAEPGQMIAIVAVGDTGIEATGEFAAIPVVVAG